VIRRLEDLRSQQDGVKSAAALLTANDGLATYGTLLESLSDSDPQAELLAA